jgi:hypothetical protein
MWQFLVVLPLLAVPAPAQELERSVAGSGNYSKFLTPGQLDRWVFEGEKGETVLAYVTSKEFDPILELARSGAPGQEDKVLAEVDDPGNESRFSIRLPEKAQYKIRIHAFKYQGGGNYTLEIRRFRAQPITMDRALVGTFDREGKGYHYFEGVKGQIVIPRLNGGTSKQWSLLDFKGRPMKDWAGTVLIEDGGECSLIVSGRADYRYDLLVGGARWQTMPKGKETASSLQPGELDVWNFQGKAGDFRLFEGDRKGVMLSRLVYVPREKRGEERITGPGDQPEVQLLPLASRRGRMRLAAILGREGNYQLQLLGTTSASYTLTMRDPSVPIRFDQEVDGKLPVSGASFYSFKAVPGQLIQASLTSQQFAPVMYLYDLHGNILSRGGESADGLEVRLTFMVMKEGLHRLRVCSLGDGGGGDYRLSLGETKLKELQLGCRDQGTLRAGGVDFWAFSGKEGQIVFLSVRSSAFEPTVGLYSPDGVRLAAEDRGADAATGSLVALKLPKTGRYTVWISSELGAGEYTVRLIDGE